MANFEIFFSQIAYQLDLTDTEQDAIVGSYESVGSFLKDSEYLSIYNPNVFPQGSVRLGTIVKPLKTDDYDIDLVCELKDATNLSPQDVKQLVGKSLKNSKYASQLEKEHGRCWTLSYNASPPYHLDILAGVSISNNRVKATIKKDGSQEYSWLFTNPKGFAEWFDSLYSRKMFYEDRGSVEEVNIYKNKSPLQRAVQLIKRHRDVYFENKPDLGPASVIITALSGLCYKGEDRIEDILKNGPIAWSSKIGIENGRYIIKIPNLPDDNYADKWNGEDPKAAEIFFEWHSKLILDLDRLFSQTKSDSFIKVAKEMFKESTVDKVLNENLDLSNSLNETFDMNFKLPMKIEDTHPLFKHALPISSERRYLPRSNASIKIIGQSYSSEEDSHNGVNVLSTFSNNSMLLDKDVYLRFRASIDGAKNVFLRWQITNTGEEACKEGTSSLRGKFELSEKNYEWTKFERTSYSGTHFVQAFLIDSYTNSCIAKSNILTINIKGDMQQ